MQRSTRCWSSILHLFIGFLLISSTTQQVDWTALPSVRAGQIDSIVTLTTSQNVSPSLTEQTAEYLNDITGADDSELQSGVSLSSYESWMTDTFSFNITVQNVSISKITVKFLVLENTFFTRAKVHYIVVWRSLNTSAAKNFNFPGGILPATQPNPLINYNNIEVLYGCYLTPGLRVGGLVETIGGALNSSIIGVNGSSLVIMTMIAGMQMSNSVGLNNYVDVQTSFVNTDKVQYKVSAQKNNFLTEICLTTVIYDPSVSNYSMKAIIQYNTISLNSTNRGLGDVAYSERFDGPHRMFFGFSRFNLSMADTRYLNVEASNISLVSLLYDKNSAMNEVVINMLFFVLRTCHDANQYYNPLTYACETCSPSPNVKFVKFGAPGYYLCNPCHYSCLTCKFGQDSTQCQSCNAHRTLSAAGVPSSCPCDSGFADIGQPDCVPCGDVMKGCLNCSSKDVCNLCDSTTLYAATPDTTTKQCTCSNNSSFLVSGFCLPYSGCVEAQLFDNQQVCTTCDASLNYIRNDTTLECICNEGYLLYNATRPYYCYDQCNDSIAAIGHCDDGNNDPGDGCDENCNVENGFHCTTNYTDGKPGNSTCVLITSVSVTYLYAQRIVNTNKFTMAFRLNPIQPNLTSVSFNSSNFVTNLPVQNQAISYDPSTGTVYLNAEYMESIEGSSQTVKVSFLNNANFYAKDTEASFTCTGINARLVLEDKSSYNSILQYVVLGEGVLAILLTIFTSVVGLKLAGIELLIPIQLIYFSLSTLKFRPSYVSSLNNLKYSNGYSGILSYDYDRTYSQHSALVGIQYETEFLLSTNIMIGVFLLTLLWLLIHHLIIKYKEYKLQSFLKQMAIYEQLNPRKDNHSDSSDDKQEGENDEQKVKLRRRPNDSQSVVKESELREDHHYSHKIFSFQVDRFYFVFYLVLINQMLFGFNVMSLNLPISAFHFPQELSVIVCNFMLFLMMGNVVFIFYDQQSNKMINFTCINDRYAYLYLALNAAFIILLSFTFQYTVSLYILTALSSGFLLLVIIERPYSNALLQLQNLVAVYLHFMLLSCLVLLCVVQGTSLSELGSLIITLLIVVLIMVGEVLTIVRVVVKVNFKKAFDDLKSPFNSNYNENTLDKRVIEKNLDLLGEAAAQIIPPDSVRNGLFTPKDKMIDWEARNTEEYESLKQKDNFNGEINQERELPESESEHHDDRSEKDDKLNQLEILKKKLRNNLKLKRETESKKSD